MGEGEVGVATRRVSQDPTGRPSAKILHKGEIEPVETISSEQSQPQIEGCGTHPPQKY